jgi:hypothetical protein
MDWATFWAMFSHSSGHLGAKSQLEYLICFANLTQVFKHVVNPKQPPSSPQSPFSIVTALVDKIRVQSSILPDQVSLKLVFLPMYVHEICLFLLSCDKLLAYGQI